MINKGISSILFFIMGFTVSYAQQSINTANGNGSGNGGVISYSVGQVVYSVNTAATGSITEGVQQPYEISVVSSIETADGVLLSCLAYPNPVSDRLILKVENTVFNNLSFKLIGPDGRILINKNITDPSTTVAMNDRVPAPYILIIYQKNRAIKTFKVIKK